MRQTGNGKDAGSGAAAQTVTVRSLLVGWANEQDAWVRELVSEVILAGKPLTESQLDALYQMFLREKALAPGGPVSVAALTDDASLLDAGAGLYLTHLGDLKNVNALATGTGGLADSRENTPWGKGEVVSSILTGSTMKSKT
jgi:hypothetical protein